MPPEVELVTTFFGSVRASERSKRPPPPLGAVLATEDASGVITQAQVDDLGRTRHVQREGAEHGPGVGLLLLSALIFFLALGGWDGTFGDPSELFPPGIQWITPSTGGSGTGTETSGQGHGRRRLVYRIEHRILN